MSDQAHGTSYMMPAMLLADVFEIAFGVARLGKLAGNTHIQTYSI